MKRFGIIDIIKILILTLFLNNCSGFDNVLKNNHSWNSMTIGQLNNNWQMEEKNKKSISFKWVGDNDEEKAGIYLEYIKVPNGRELLINEYLGRIIDNYKEIYEAIRTELIQVNDIQGYTIYHKIKKDNKILQTTILPKGPDYIIILFYASKENYEELKVDYKNFIEQLNFFPNDNV